MSSIAEEMGKPDHDHWAVRVTGSQRIWMACKMFVEFTQNAPISTRCIKVGLGFSSI